jgi:hypothetical protein
MTIHEVVNKLALEMAFDTGHIEDIKIYKEKLQMAVVIGKDHFFHTTEEIIAMDYEGFERGRFKSVTDASEKLGICRSSIDHVLMKRQHSAGGYLFVREIDQELILRKEDNDETVLTKAARIKR